MESTPTKYSNSGIFLDETYKRSYFGDIYSVGDKKFARQVKKIPLPETCLVQYPTINSPNCAVVVGEYYITYNQGYLYCHEVETNLLTSSLYLGINDTTSNVLWDIVNISGVVYTITMYNGVYTMQKIADNGLGILTLISTVLTITPTADSYTTYKCMVMGVDRMLLVSYIAATVRAYIYYGTNQKTSAIALTTGMVSGQVPDVIPITSDTFILSFPSSTTNLKTLAFKCESNNTITLGTGVDKTIPTSTYYYSLKSIDSTRFLLYYTITGTYYVTAVIGSLSTLTITYNTGLIIDTANYYTYNWHSLYKIADTAFVTPMGVLSFSGTTLSFKNHFTTSGSDYIWYFWSTNSISGESGVYTYHFIIPFRNNLFISFGNPTGSSTVFSVSPLLYYYVDDSFYCIYSKLLELPCVTQMTGIEKRSILCQLSPTKVLTVSILSFVGNNKITYRVWEKHTEFNIWILKSVITDTSLAFTAIERSSSESRMFELLKYNSSSCFLNLYSDSQGACCRGVLVNSDNTVTLGTTLTPASVRYTYNGYFIGSYSGTYNLSFVINQTTGNLTYSSAGWSNANPTGNPSDTFEDDEYVISCTADASVTFTLYNKVGVGSLYYKSFILQPSRLETTFNSWSIVVKPGVTWHCVKVHKLKTSKYAAILTPYSDGSWAFIVFIDVAGQYAQYSIRPLCLLSSYFDISSFVNRGELICINQGGPGSSDSKVFICNRNKVKEIIPQNAYKLNTSNQSTRVFKTNIGPYNTLHGAGATPGHNIGRDYSEYDDNFIRYWLTPYVMVFCSIPKDVSTNVTCYIERGSKNSQAKLTYYGNVVKTDFDLLPNTDYFMDALGNLVKYPTSQYIGKSITTRELYFAPVYLETINSDPMFICS